MEIDSTGEFLSVRFLDDDWWSCTNCGICSLSALDDEWHQDSRRGEGIGNVQYTCIYSPLRGHIMYIYITCKSEY